VIVLADERDPQLLAEGLGCGASGYITKDCSLAEVVDAVRSVARGDMLVPPAMLGPLLADLLERKRDHEEALLRLSRLSARERQVLALVARGKKTAEIADTLVISPETARTHVQNILQKLNVHSRLEAASFVIEHGLVAHLEEAA
jgi:DNA-binding NarL/FixJ family response regulator